jgi:hypothetical protein
MSRAIYLAFLYFVVFEGALRKWVFPGLTNELFVFKDVLLVLAVGALYVVERHKLAVVGVLRFQPFEGALWQLWVVIALVGAAMSGFGLNGVIGLRYYLVPLLLFAIHPVLATNLDELTTFFGQYLALCFAVCLLGFVQYYSSPESLINRYSWAPSSEMDVATFGEAADRATDAHVRITGTFSYISPFAAYLQFMYFVAIGMFLSAREERARLWCAVVLAAITAGLFMTGSRGPTVTCLLLTILFLPSLRASLGGKFAFVGIFLGVVALVLGAWMMRDIVDVLVQRNEAAGDAGERVTAALFFPVYTLIYSDFWGEGLGATFLGMGQLLGTGGFEYRFDEVRQDRLAVELGVLGYLALLTFKIYFMVATFRFARHAAAFPVRVWALVSFAYQASLLWTVPIYNSVAMIYYFFCIALFAWLRGLDASQRVAVGAPPTAAGLSLRGTRFR